MAPVGVLEVDRLVEVVRVMVHDHRNRGHQGGDGEDQTDQTGRGRAVLEHGLTVGGSRAGVKRGRTMVVALGPATSE